MKTVLLRIVLILCITSTAGCATLRNVIDTSKTLGGENLGVEDVVATTVIETEQSQQPVPTNTRVPTVTLPVPTATPLPTQVQPPAPTATYTVLPTEVLTDTLVPVPAGADYFAVNFSEVPADQDGYVEPGRFRLYEPTNSRTDVEHGSPGREYCAWAVQWKIGADPSLSPDGQLSAQFHMCVELNAVGSGTLLFEVWPDSVGYDQSDVSGEGLALWLSGVSGQYFVSTDGGTTWTDEIPLTTGPEGVNLPANWPTDGPGILIKVEIMHGFFQMSLGEIRNQIIPVYGPPYSP